MLFNSIEFIFYFLPVTITGFFLLERWGPRLLSRAWLLLCSLFFYSWWNINYLPLIVGSIVGNYFVADWICKSNGSSVRKGLFVAGVVANLLLLAAFKYLDFFIANTNVVFSTSIPLQQIVLPLGISFFTLQQIAFLVDAYEGLVEEHSFLNYGVFVSFFPQLIAGPIVHHAEMMPQFEERGRFKIDHLVQGLVLFTIGFSKKILLADTFGDWVREVFDKGYPTFFEAWTAMYCYAFQLYFDFSGYVDMAMGAALIMNIKLPLNFRSPYRSVTVIEFWQRWHMTLTNFITTYLYTPILRSFKKVTFAKAMVATVGSMTIAGLWHGANWTYVLFGVVHGVALMVNNIRQKRKSKKLPRWLAWFINFHFVAGSLLIFRSASIDKLIGMLYGMLGKYGAVLPQFMEGMFSSEAITYGDALGRLGGYFWTPVCLIAAFIIIFCSKPSHEMVEDFKPNPWTAIWYGVLFVLCIFKLNEPSEFLYFQF